MADITRSKSRDTTGTNDADCDLEATVISNSVAKILNFFIKKYCEL